MRTRLLASAALAATFTTSALGIVACSSFDPTGVDGTVTNRTQKHDPATKASDFYLTVNGRTYRVDYSTWSTCFRGSHYPACKNR